MRALWGEGRENSCVGVGREVGREGGIVELVGRDIGVSGVLVVGAVLI